MVIRVSGMALCRNVPKSASTFKSVYVVCEKSWTKKEGNLNIGELLDKVLSSYRLELFDHLDAITLHLSMNLSKLGENFAGPWLQLTYSDRWKDVAEICFFFVVVNPISLFSFVLVEINLVRTIYLCTSERGRSKSGGVVWCAIQLKRAQCSTNKTNLWQAAKLYNAYFDQSTVHALATLQIFQPLQQTVIAQDGPRKSQCVGCRAGHVFDKAVLDFL